MPYQLDTELDLTPRTDKKYIVSSAHRRTQKDKSKWTVDVEVEVDCFIESDSNSWVEKIEAWGIVENGGSLIELGINSFNESLKIAKFVDKTGKHIWHGYPADYCRNLQDRPGIRILQDWRNKMLIQKHHIVKIRQGKSCNL